MNFLRYFRNTLLVAFGVAVLACVFALLAALFSALPSADAAVRERVDLRVHDDRSCATVPGVGGCAWTPAVGVPFILADGPSRAAGKVIGMSLGDVVVVHGALAGIYVVVDSDGFKTARGSQPIEGLVYVEADGMTGCHKRTLELVG